jgi:hypothetical protein
MRTIAVAESQKSGAPAEAVIVPDRRLRAVGLRAGARRSSAQMSHSGAECVPRGRPTQSASLLCHHEVTIMPWTTGLPDYRTTGLPDYRTARRTCRVSERPGLAALAPRITVEGARRLHSVARSSQTAPITPGVPETPKTRGRFEFPVLRCFEMAHGWLVWDSGHARHALAESPAFAYRDGTALHELPGSLPTPRGDLQGTSAER